MIVIQKATWKSTNDFIAGKPAETREIRLDGYNGVALCDRAAQSAAKGAATTAGSTAAQFGGEAQGEHAALTPFYQREMTAEHGFDPTQTGELLTAAGAGIGGAAGAEEGRAAEEQAKTRNASGFTKSLDELARDRMKAGAGAAEGVAAEDVMAAKAENQAGAAGMQGLYGTDVSGQLKAMGQQNEDIATQVEAGKSGWMQNMDQTISALSGAAKNAYGAPGGGGFMRS